jgi:dihydroxy-acid dehydratase
MAAVGNDNGNNGSALGKGLRSRAWFNNPESADMTALYLERYLNYGLTIEELQSDRPIIGIAQTGSDLSPCNRATTWCWPAACATACEAGGIPIEFPLHPIQETGKRPTAGLDRNLAISASSKCCLAIRSMAWC